MSSKTLGYLFCEPFVYQPENRTSHVYHSENRISHVRHAENRILHVRVHHTKNRSKNCNWERASGQLLMT